MNKLLIMAAVMVAALSCVEEGMASSEESFETEGQRLSVIASVADELTRVAASSTDGYEWSFEWEKDDCLTFISGDDANTFAIDSENFNKYNATFTGTVPLSGQAYLFSGYGVEESLICDLTAQDGTLGTTPLKSGEMIDFAEVTDVVESVKMKHTGAFVKISTTFGSDMSGYSLVAIEVEGMNSSHSYDAQSSSDSYTSEDIIITLSTPLKAEGTQSVPFNIFPTAIATGESINILLIFEDAEGSNRYAIFTKSPAEDLTYDFERATVNTITISCSEADLVLDGMAFTKDMGVGWNLGNTLDAYSDSYSGLTTETSWGNPYTTKAMVDMVAAKGFKTMRVPVTWHSHIGEYPDYTIDQEWLDRVEEVVNYGLDNDLYVIINIHHDEDIIIPLWENEWLSMVIIDRIWSQLSERFKDYGDKLIFETLNEMRVTGSAEEWTGGTSEGRDCINKFHATAVEAIRSSGGNNKIRKLMLATYGASVVSDAMWALELPDDDNIIVALHSYTPYTFCLVSDGTGTTTWGTDADKAEVDALFASIKSTFIDRGYPVVLGEWASFDNDNTDYREIHATYYANAALKCDICPVVWDDNGWFKLLNRSGLYWYYEGIVDAIIGAYNDNK